MAPLSFSNLVNQNPYQYKSLSTPAGGFKSLSPISSALNSKINPSPLRPIANSTPMTMIQGPTLSGAVSNLNKAVAPVARPSPTPAPVSQPVSNPAPTGGPDYKGLLIQNIESQLADKKAQLAKLTKEEEKKPEPPTFGGILGSLASFNPANDPAYKQALGAYEKAVKDLTDFRSKFAGKIAGIESTPIPLEFQQGRAQVLGRQAASTEAALQGAVTQQQSAISQALTGQGLVQQALSSAAGLATPSVAEFGKTVFDPLTGKFTGGGSDIDTALAQYAQLYATGQQSAIPASITSNPILNARLIEMAKQINPNFNVNIASGMQSGQQNVAGQVVGMQAANNAAKGIENTIKNFLVQNPNLNPSELVAGNIVQQWLQGKQLADPRYQTLFNYLNEYVSTLAPILGIGGDVTNLKTEIAQSFVNAQASGASISQVLDDISRLADKKIQDFQSGGFNSQGSQGGGTTASAGGFNFVLNANGQWVPAQ